MSATRSAVAHALERQTVGSSGESVSGLSFLELGRPRWSHEAPKTGNIVHFSGSYAVFY